MLGLAVVEAVALGCSCAGALPPHTADDGELDHVRRWGVEQARIGELVRTGVLRALAAQACRKTARRQSTFEPESFSVQSAEVRVALWGSFEEAEKRWGEVLQLLREDRDLRREALLKSYAKAAQKPDACVLRDTAGPLADRLFPLSESWDRRWFGV